MIQHAPQTPKMPTKFETAPILHPGTGVLVTGGGIRIGAALVEMAAASGASVAIHYNTSSAAAEALAEKVTASGGHAVPIQADLTEPNATAALCDMAASTIGTPIACLINNASLFENDSPANFATSDFDANMAIHARAPAQLAQAMRRALPDSMPGVIINMLDQKSFNPDPEFFSYTISKYALLGLTEVLARALAPMVRVNGVALGLTLPPPSMSEARFAELQATQPLNAGAEVSDVVRAVNYLIGADKVTGQVLCVDGGEHMG